MKDILFSLILVALAAILYPFAAVAVKYHARSIAWNAKAAPINPEIQRMLAYNAALASQAREGTLPTGDGGFAHERLTTYNASLFDQSHFSEALTSYAVGYVDPEPIADTLEFVAPAVVSPMKVEFATFSSPEEFLSMGVDDDVRTIGADFPTLKYTSDKQIKKLLNHGIAIEIDEDEIGEFPGWEEHYTAKLLRYSDRLSLRRAVTRLSAAATNTAKTWSTAAGKNPDGDVRAELIAASNVSGIRPNRILYGDTAWDTRVSSHEAQDNAGGYAAAQRTPETLATFLQIDGVRVSKERFAATATAASLSEIVSTKVIMFNAISNPDRNDPSNIKRFTANVAARNGGGKVAVHLRQVGDKKWRLAVEKYELTAVTSTLGIRQFTVAAA